MALRDGCPNVGDDNPSSSPKTRLKFLCSHGGKILPRPLDGLLKYVGGETRIVAVPRDINFSDLMKKLKSLFDGDVVLKYQLLPEDLDVLVSVKSDEDLKHMLDEYDRHQTEVSPKFRAFLFGSKPASSDNQTISSHSRATGQSYIDAINGVVGRSPANSKLAPINANHPTFFISSAGSSPESSSPEFHPNCATRHEAALPSSGLANRGNPLHKVRSSPTLCSFTNIPSQGDVCCNHQIQKQRHRCCNGHHSPMIVQDATTSRAEAARGHVYQGQNHYHLPSRHHHWISFQASLNVGC